MYDEAVYKFDWSSAIKKGFIILLFVVLALILILVFSGNHKKSDFDYFQDNLNTMVSVAQNYYTQNDLNQDTITLEEMIDKKMVLEFVDENGKTCDTKNSYAKLDNNKIIVHLTCSKQVEEKEITL